MDKSIDHQRPNLPSESTQGSGGPASLIPCSVCQREIPLSAAVWRESSDYVAYFCGLSCYDRWRSQRGDV